VNDIRDYLAKIGKKGGKARLVKMSAEERQKVARRGAETRWAEHRKRMKAFEAQHKKNMKAIDKSIASIEKTNAQLDELLEKQKKAKARKKAAK
jgi:hypothetical protein